MNPKKLTKDQIQKIFLSGLGFVALIYCYFNFFLGPLNKSRASMMVTIADLQSKTASSKAEMKKTANLEIQAKEATGRYETSRPRRRKARLSPVSTQDARLLRRSGNQQGHCASRFERRF
jgi:hypothetical protein